ncbi:ABC transporter [Bacteroides fragilis]
MKLKSLILGDIRQQYKYGFMPIYVIYTSVYYSIAHSSYAVERTMYNYPYISDPVLIGLMFMGAIILFEKSEKVMQALAVSCISIHAYILSKVISIGLISLLSGVLIALFSDMEYSYIHLAVGIMLGSALFTLVGISLSAFISTMNNFMLIMVPTLIISVAPISVYTMGYKSGAMLLHPSISLIELMSGNISVISLIAISIWCIAMYIFSCLSVKK